MSEQVAAVIGQTLAYNLDSGGFRCFCGRWFPDRPRFDEHLVSHPGRFTVCDCCKRILPKGPWKIDRNYNFVPVEEAAEGARLPLESRRM